MGFISGRGILLAIVVTVAGASFTLGFFVGKAQGPSLKDLDAELFGSASPENRRSGYGGDQSRITENNPSSGAGLNSDSGLGTVDEPATLPRDMFPPESGTSSSKASTESSREPEPKEPPREPKKPSVTASITPPKPKAPKKQDTVKPRPPKSGTTKAASPPPAISTGKWNAQAGAFSSKTDANALKKRLESKGFKVYIVIHRDTKGQKLYRVKVGGYPSKSEAQAAARKLKRIEGIDAFVSAR